MDAGYRNDRTAIYVSNDTRFLCGLGKPWAEITRYNLWADYMPVHPLGIIRRVEEFLRDGVDFCTVHPLVFATMGRLVRQKKCKKHPRIVYYECDEEGRQHTQFDIPVDIKGEMITPWPEPQEKSLLELEFYERYAKDDNS